MMYNQFENTLRQLEICNTHIDNATDNGMSLDKFKATLLTSYERDSFVKLREHCARFVALYDEMDTIP